MSEKIDLNGYREIIRELEKGQVEHNKAMRKLCEYDLVINSMKMVGIVSIALTLFLK